MNFLLFKYAHFDLEHIDQLNQILLAESPIGLSGLLVYQYLTVGRQTSFSNRDLLLKMRFGQSMNK